MILITRQRNFAADTAQKLKSLGYNNLILPMLHIRYIYKEVVDDGYDAVIFTSKNAVYATDHIKWIKTKKIYSVGDATANAIKNSHPACNIIAREDKMQNNKNLISSFLENSTNKEKVIYFSGLHIAGNIEKELKNIGYNITREVVYDAIMQSYLSIQALESIKSYVKMILFYSPRTAKAFQSLYEKYHIDLSEKVAICISQKTADNLDINSWSNLIIADQSSDLSMIESVKKIYNTL